MKGPELIGAIALVAAVGLVAGAVLLTREPANAPRPPKTVRARSTTSSEAADDEGTSRAAALDNAALSILHDAMSGEMDDEGAAFLQEQLVEAMALERLGTVASRVSVARKAVDDLLARLAKEPKLEGELTPLQERAIEQEARRWSRQLAAALDPSTRPPRRTVEGHRRVPWRTLTGFTFEPGMTLPPEVQALDGKRVAIDGYMIITSWGEGRRVEQFLFTESMWGCCFARTPQIHEGIVVDAPRVRPHEGPITVLGTLRVAERREAGEVTGIYRLEASRVTALEE